MRRVVKLGGSLLDREDLLVRLPQWLRELDHGASEPVESLFVVGGGPLIDAVRTLDHVRPRDSVATHWMCIDLMETTLRLVRSWFPEWHVVSSIDEFQNGLANGFATHIPSLISVASFYRRETACDLPMDWRTTSDAIAALLAIQVNADELVLLKSCDIDPTATVDQLSAAGIVDAALPMIVTKVRRLRVQKL